MPEVQIDHELAKTTELVPEVDILMGGDQKSGLKELIEKTELVGANQEREQRFLKLAENCKWVGTAAELTYLMSDKSVAEKPKSPFILGISNWLSATNSYAVLLSGKNWYDAYDEFGIEATADGHTQRFMQQLADSDRDVVFFVPPDLYSNPNGHVTEDEMEWLLKNPEKAKKVYLVFGGYDFINEDWYRKNIFNFTAETRPKHLAEAFTKWVNVLFADDVK